MSQSSRLTHEWGCGGNVLNRDRGVYPLSHVYELAATRNKVRVSTLGMRKNHASLKIEVAVLAYYWISSLSGHETI